ncbi:MAG: hypothetical protein JJT99_12625 [Rhodobacteraceae bacterium]|nr:hypothetical protein [Paracoccaceae bacterium]
MSMELDQAFVWIDEIYHELRLPGVTKGTFMGRPALLHRGRSIIGSKDGENLVVLCPPEIKEMLMDAEPARYFLTDHYKGYPAVLIRPNRIDKAHLRLRIEAAWRMHATMRQLSEFDKTTGR